MPRGGAGRGQGRKKGGVNRRTLALKAVADAALTSGCSPLEVLLENMRFYHSKINMAEQMLATAIANKEAPAALVEVLRKLCNFRSEAGRFAVEAAPYVHAKLASVTVGGDPNNPVRHEVEHIYTPEELSKLPDHDITALYRETVPAGSVPPDEPGRTEH